MSYLNTFRLHPNSIQTKTTREIDNTLFKQYLYFLSGMIHAQFYITIVLKIERIVFIFNLNLTER